MAYLKLVDINGLGSSYYEKLASAGITSSQSLYEKCKTQKGRLEVSRKSKISLKLILRWVKKLDLLRIEGIGADILKLLETSEIDSIETLSKQNPGKLFENFEKINHDRNITKRTPSLWEIESWISQAKFMPKLIKNTNSSLSSEEACDTKDQVSPEVHLLYYMERLKHKNFRR